MGNSSKIGLSIFVSALISMILVAGAGYFLLPLIYPNINEEIEEFEETPNIVLQSKYIDVSTQVTLYDEDLDFVKINDTELSITTQGNSSLSVQFTMTTLMGISSLFVGHLYFEIVIVISGVGNKTIPVKYYRSSSGIDEQNTQHIAINYNTGVISNGTYTIEAFWRSLESNAFYNYLRSYVWSSGDGFYNNYTRTIWVQELRG